MKKKKEGCVVIVGTWNGMESDFNKLIREGSIIRMGCIVLYHSTLIITMGVFPSELTNSRIILSLVFFGGRLHSLSLFLSFSLSVLVWERVGGKNETFDHRI